MTISEPESMLQQKTHREVKSPQVSARHLADYMAASERAKRTIVRGCKYQPTARVVQHDEAKTAVSGFLLKPGANIGALTTRAQQLRDRLSDDIFERDLFDHNADYLDRFAKIFPALAMPKAEMLSPGKIPAIHLNGVKITVEIALRLRRLTKTNKVRVGACALRYAKGKALTLEVGEWQSAFIFAYLGLVPTEEAAEPEHKLCLTLDAHAGTLHLAPTDSIERFHNMEAACATIAERWPNILPPPNAVL
jgi:hypothetical protein